MAPLPVPLHVLFSAAGVQDLSTQVRLECMIRACPFRLSGSQLRARSGTSTSQIRTQEAFTVEVDHVGRVVGAPDLGFPCNLVDVLAELGSVGETGDVDETCG